MMHNSCKTKGQKNKERREQRQVSASHHSSYTVHGFRMRRKHHTVHLRWNGKELLSVSQQQDCEASIGGAEYWLWSHSSTPTQACRDGQN